MAFDFNRLQQPGRPYFIAEIGANHNGDMDLCRRLVDAAKAAGADCAKFQSWTKTSLWAKSVYEGTPALEQDIDTYTTRREQLREIADYCQEVGIDFGCTPFSKEEADFLVDELKIRFLKIASMDVNNLMFLRHLASKGIPLVLSTGLSTVAEIAEAVTAIEDTGNAQLVLLHCVANYPPIDGDVHLRNMDMLRDNFPYPVGFSDHTLGTAIPMAAVARGARLIEKHFTLDKNMPGWDHAVSADPADLAVMVRDANRICEALGSYRRVLNDTDRKMIPIFRRSIVTARAIRAGEILQESDLVLKRPGTGMPPSWLAFVVGRSALRDLEEDVVLGIHDI